DAARFVAHVRTEAGARGQRARGVDLDHADLAIAAYRKAHPGDRHRALVGECEVGVVLRVDGDAVYEIVRGSAQRSHPRERSVAAGELHHESVAQAGRRTRDAEV